MKIGIDAGAGNIRVALLDSGIDEVKIISASSEGKPVEKLGEILREIPDRSYSIGVTGSNRKLIAGLLGIRDILDPVAILKYLKETKFKARTVFDVGKENSRLYIVGEENGNLVLKDFSINLACGAGGGTVLEKMRKRLKFGSLDGFVEAACKAKSVANISARCAVFAESDVVHHYQRGSSVESIAAGLCQVVSRNFNNDLCKDKEIRKPILMIGGVSENRAVVKYLGQELGEEIIVTKDSLDVKAIGAAFASEVKLEKSKILERLASYDAEIKSSLKPLDLTTLQTEALPYEVISEKDGEKISLSLNRNYDFCGKEVFLGLDVGSVSTKAALVDKKGEFILGIYGRTSGKPIDAVRNIIKEVGNLDIKGKKIKDFVKILGASTTGSGRDVAGKIIGADIVKNEITAQARGAAYFFPDVDTVIEIGGQDSKYIFMDRGIVIENEMNRACAASTGSFLEEQADSLGINIEEEFGDYALVSQRPLNLGDRCTVFITNSLLKFQNAPLEDKLAGLSYSICLNYLNRVVREKPIGEKIVFQGAVAYNKGVGAGFGTILGKKIYVPKYPHLTGAIGAAQIAKENYENGV